MNGSVVAVVVTFNRKVLLLECLNALFMQTVPLAKIIIVDNFSSDGTESYLKENGYLGNPIIDYKRFHENTGGAGGFSRGLQIALNYPVDWFWLMDDDVAAEPTCLEELLKYKDISECLHPRKLFTSGANFQWEHIFDAQTGECIGSHDISFTNGKDITFTNVACFEGMLVSKNIIDKIGLPDEKYFIIGDDVLFGIKASTHTNVSYVRRAKMIKLIPPVVVAPWKFYYMIRNKFFLRKDTLDYLNISSKKTSYVYFLFERVLEVMWQCLRKDGWKYVIPAAKGLLHGMTNKRYC